MKKLLTILTVLSLLYSSGAYATTYGPSGEQFSVYSQECPSAAIEFAENNYVPFLIASVESGAFQVGDTIQLGSPFTIQTEYSDSTVYYFPITSDGAVIATFRVYQDTSTNSYVGIMSQYLAEELSALSTDISSPVLLFIDAGNTMVSTENRTEVLINDPMGKAPVGVKPSTVGLYPVNPLSSIYEISSSELTSHHAVSKYLNLDIIETQGSEEWCYAYATSIIVRYVTNKTPTALDIMRLFYPNPKPENSLTNLQVLNAALTYGVDPTYKSGRINPYPEIDASRPIFLRCEMSTGTKGKDHHAIVMRGYNISSNVYSIWNPWCDFYETMSISTNQYMRDGYTFTWVDTIYNWQ